MSLIFGEDVNYGHKDINCTTYSLEKWPVTLQISLHKHCVMGELPDEQLGAAQSSWGATHSVKAVS